MNKSGVVYRLTCADCDASYVGQTKRILGERVKEHQRNVREKKDSSVLYNHCREYTHNIDWQSVSILDRENVWLPRLVSEMVHIHLQEFPLNRIDDTKMLARQYTQLMYKLKQ